MHNRSERQIFKEILLYTNEELTNLFEAVDDGICYRFTEKANQNNYITVNKSISGVPVNANFNFPRPAGSNNYPELLNVGRRLAYAFNLPLG